MTLPLLVVLSLLNGCAEKEKFIVYGSPQNESEVEALIKKKTMLIVRRLSNMTIVCLLQYKLNHGKSGKRLS